MRQRVSYRMTKFSKVIRRIFFLILCISNKIALDLVEGFAPSGGCACGTPGAGVLGVMLFWTLKLVTGVVISFSKHSVFVMKRGVG